MNVWFVKTKALYFTEEIIALLSDVVSEIQKNPDKKYTENEIRTLSSEFFNLINTKTSELQKDQSYQDTDFIESFKLAIVAIIDDTLLTLNWSGRQYWANFLLETRFFSTRISGDKFFENCRRIIQSRTPKSKELAAIYHVCLIAGFRGRYFHSQYATELNTYRTDLYNYFNREATESKHFADPAILPSGQAENTSKTLLNEKHRFFNRLLIFNFIIVFIFVITSYFVWFHNANLVFRNL